MKKKLLVFVLLSVVFSCFALDGVVVDVLGKVEKQDGDSWIPIKQGDILVPGDIVSTGFKSEAVITIGESTVTVKALTRMTIEQLYEKNKNHVSSIYLDVGSVSADVKPVENKRVGFTVKTPAVTASVRGTAGVVYAYGKVEAIRGKWGLSAPRPKVISFERGDVEDNTEATVEKSIEKVEVAPNEVDTSETTTEQNEVSTNEPETTNEQNDVSTNNSQNTVEENLTTEIDLENVVEKIDDVLETMLSGAVDVKEVFVTAGEVAYVNPIKVTEILTPQEVKQENSSSLGNSSSNSAKETAEKTIVEEKLYSDITVEIIIPE